ncbi:MAG: polyhydroxyalkanoic acid system family protein, partial [bacterium]|jgi:hypothetical protein
MQHRIAHSLPHPLAITATRKALETYRTQFPQLRPGGEWVTESRAKVWFQAPAGKLEGFIEVLPDAITIDLEVPFLLRAFKGQAIKVIEAEVKAWIQKAQKGELG